VRAFTKQVLAEHERIDILVNNASVGVRAAFS
jgi:NAD(P)-dependent dehydrogenase (short-subunit alcohol dehydrogenase family)